MSPFGNCTRDRRNSPAPIPMTPSWSEAPCSPQNGYELQLFRENVMRPCRKCGADFEPTEKQLINRAFLCKPCQRANTAKSDAKRKALGLKRKRNVNKAHAAAYQKEYWQRPQAKALRIVRERQRMRKPEERI